MNTSYEDGFNLSNLRILGEEEGVGQGGRGKGGGCWGGRYKKGREGREKKVREVQRERERGREGAREGESRGGRKGKHIGGGKRRLRSKEYTET